MTVSNKDKNSNEDNHTEIDPLDELNKIDGIYWIRILYCYPEEIDDKLLKKIHHIKHLN